MYTDTVYTTDEGWSWWEEQQKIEQNAGDDEGREENEVSLSKSKPSITSRSLALSRQESKSLSNSLAGELPWLRQESQLRCALFPLPGGGSQLLELPWLVRPLEASAAPAFHVRRRRISQRRHSTTRFRGQPSSTTRLTTIVGLTAWSINND
jgi:hypothetical protein